MLADTKHVDMLPRGPCRCNKWKSYRCEMKCDGRCKDRRNGAVRELVGVERERQVNSTNQAG
jgi:hypothetical protein